MIVRLPPIVAIKEIKAHANRFESSSRYSILGFANWITATFPNSWEAIRIKAEIPITDENVLKGTSPTIDFLFNQPDEVIKNHHLYICLPYLSWNSSGRHILDNNKCTKKYEQE